MGEINYTCKNQNKTVQALVVFSCFSLLDEPSLLCAVVRFHCGLCDLRKTNNGPGFCFKQFGASGDKTVHARTLVGSFQNSGVPSNCNCLVAEDTLIFRLCVIMQNNNKSTDRHSCTSQFTEIAPVKLL